MPIKELRYRTRATRGNTSVSYSCKGTISWQLGHKLATVLLVGIEYCRLLFKSAEHVYAAPPLVGPASSVVEDKLAEWRSRYSLPPSVILRVPTSEERASSYILREFAIYEALFDSGLRGRDSPCSCRRGESRYPGATASYRSPPSEFPGSGTNDPFAAYQEAAKVMSAKKGSSSRSASGYEVMIIGSHRSTEIKLDPFASLPGKRPKSGGVTTCWAQQSADIARSAGSLGTALSNLNLNVFPQDGTVLPKGDSSEVIQVLQGGLLRESSIAYLFSFLVREGVEVLKRQVTGEREQRAVREFEIRKLKEKEARNKGDPLPTFEDEPAITPSSDMDVYSSVKPRGYPT
ncbi:hypothetical protein Bca52824_073302 [Brassica carinata]|uniref:Uncharacterized protein n=1 Tax=Brassica carinata TaxID=52824 RepID=A0A8X7QDT3_BRACI|nr:hypothetical protein Bca52824_073302 [Brassica carinata]